MIMHDSFGMKMIGYNQWPLTGGGLPYWVILGHIGDVRPEWVSFAGLKPADGCKFF